MSHHGLYIQLVTPLLNITPRFLSEKNYLLPFSTELSDFGYRKRGEGDGKKKLQVRESHTPKHFPRLRSRSTMLYFI